MVTLRDVQSYLNAHGYASPPLTVDGLDGPMTEAAVETFQRAKGLTVDGKAGPQTYAAMGFTAAAATVWTEIPDRSTPLTAVDAAKAFSAGYAQVTGHAPNAAILGLLLAQSAFETGNWGRGIHNYNFGNAKAGSGDRYIQYFRCSEIVDGVETFFDPPSPVCRFAAFANATDGAVAYIKLLKGRPNWWAGLQTGTVDGFIQGLTSRPAYFTASPSIYAAGLSRELASYAATATKYAGDAARGVAMVALGLGFLAAYAAYRHWGNT